MDFKNGGDERIAFGNVAKGQKKYGSTSRFKKAEQSLVSYNVQRGDTLAGIAVKFGVSTEQIRRVNQMWTNDSLFLRDKLLIPCHENGHDHGQLGFHQQSFDHHKSHSSVGRTTCSEDFNSSCGNVSCLSSPQEDSFSTSRRTWSHPLSDSFESEDCVVVSPSSVKFSEPSFSQSPELIWSSSDVSQCNFSEPNHGVNGVTSHSSSAAVSPTRRRSIVDHSEKSPHDFLSRIDNSIAATRNQVKERQNVSSSNHKPWVTFDSDSESDQRNSGISLSTHGKHLQFSLRKLEKKQDELFQL